MATDNENPSDETTEAASPDQGTTEETPSTGAAGFGLLFRPPEAASPPPRRPQPQNEPYEDQQDEGPEGGDDADQGEGGRPRRRRGGRGRNRSGDNGGGRDSSEDDGSRDGEKDGPEDSSGKERDGKDSSGKGPSGRGSSTKGSPSKGKKGPKDADAQKGSGEDTDGDSDEEDSDEKQSQGSARRRRRRRRGGGGGNGGGNGGNGGGNGGNGGNGGQDDPPGTVTKVRESRRNEPQAIKGSTRLEAKKQRRREGREAGRRRTIITEAEFLARRESVERVMVVRQQAERTQIGVLEDGVCVEHYVSRETTSTMIGNVYLGRVQNVLPSMEAAFVDIGKGRNAVLYAGEVNWEAQGVDGGQARKIENALSSGDPVLVQVTKDPIGHKGARLTSQVSLPGRYLVYVPEGNMTGISRKLPDTERSRLKGILKEVVPNSSGVIVRTAAEGASEQELTADVQRLTKGWEKISSTAEAKQGKKASAGGAPTLLHAEPDMTVRVIRDIFNEDFTKMVVSGEEAWREIKEYVDDVAPDLADRLEKWTGEGDVFAGHRIDEAIAKAMDRKVWLPSGGSLIIDRTEAMTVVDVNTGKFTGSGGNLEETVTKNNLEAAEEIVRQLRLRDIGGIIVVDFIDMVLESNRDLVVRRLLECLGRDRTKHQVAEVTSLGLVQMTRKRVGSGLLEVFSETCEHCDGRGIHVHAEPVAEESASGGSGGRSRRGRSKGGKDKRVEHTPEETDGNGRTPAQIAAAAHAAAVKSIAGEPTEDDVADLDSEPAATPEAAETPMAKGETAPPVQESAPRAAETEKQDPQPTRRRGGRRAASSSGAPVALQPVDLAAQPEGSNEPLTVVAGESGDSGESGEAPTAPEAEATEEAAAPRRKRKRVTTQAGPPTAGPDSD